MVKKRMRTMCGLVPSVEKLFRILENTVFSLEDSHRRNLSYTARIKG